MNNKFDNFVQKVFSEDFASKVIPAIFNVLCVALIIVALVNPWSLVYAAICAAIARAAK